MDSAGSNSTVEWSDIFNWSGAQMESIRIVRSPTNMCDGADQVLVLASKTAVNQWLDIQTEWTGVLRCLNSLDRGTQWSLLDSKCMSSAKFVGGGWNQRQREKKLWQEDQRHSLANRTTCLFIRSSSPINLIYFVILLHEGYDWVVLETQSIEIAVVAISPSKHHRCSFVGKQRTRDNISAAKN